MNVLAKQLVDDVLKGKKGQVWRGKMSSMTKWVSTCVPWRTLDGMVANGRGVDELAKIVHDRQNGKTPQ